MAATKNRARRSSHPVRSKWPLGSKASGHTGFGWASGVRIDWPVITDQSCASPPTMRTSPSSPSFSATMLPVARTRPSGLKARALIGPRWIRGWASGRLAATSQSRTSPGRVAQDVPLVPLQDPAPCRQGPAVGAERDDPDWTAVAERSADRLAAGVPEPDGPVIAAGRHGPAVGAEDGRPDGRPIKWRRRGWKRRRGGGAVVGGKGGGWIGTWRAWAAAWWRRRGGGGGPRMGGAVTWWGGVVGQ